MRLAVVLLAFAACYPGIDNADCEITCGTGGACPDNLSCVAGFCVAEGQVCSDPDLAAAYSFDEIVDNTIPDLSGNGNAIALVNGPTLGEGHAGMALHFDGGGRYGTIFNSPSLELMNSAFTIELWVFYEAAGNNDDDVVISKSTGVMNPRHEYGIEVHSSGVDDFNLYVSDDQDIEHGPFAMDPIVDRFVHIAYTYDGVVVAGYRDGVQQALQNAQLDEVIPERHEQIFVGSDNGPSQFLTGAIDELRIYRRALSHDEIVRDMNTPLQ